MMLLAQEAAASLDAEVIVFAIAGTIAILSALGMVLLRDIVHSALMLVVNLFSVAALYLALESTFLSIVQIIVYAGAIMVLFLFVIMLVGIDRDESPSTSPWRPVAAAVGVAVLAGMILGLITTALPLSGPQCGDLRPDVSVTTQTREPIASIGECVGLVAANTAEPTGSVGAIGAQLFTRYTYAFEFAALLLVVATLGAMLIGQRKDIATESDPAWAHTDRKGPQ